MKEKNGYVKWYVFAFVMALVFGIFGFVANDYYSYKESSWCRFAEIKEDVASIKEAVIWLKDLKPIDGENKNISSTEFIEKIKELTLKK